MKILVTADGSGVEAVLNKTLQTVLGTVNSINSQEIDWTSIFASTVSPAMIAGVASMFAFAIGTSVQQFIGANNAATNLNNQTSAQGFNSSLTSGVGGIYSLATAAGTTLGGATTAFNTFTQAGLDSAAAMAATTDAAGIARDTGESLTTVTSELADLFQNWGVTTTPQVTQALDGLVNASQNGKFTFSELVSTMSDQGPILSSKTNIGDTALSLAALSNQTNLSKSSIVSSFNAIAQGVANPLSNIDLLVTNTGKDISSGPNGLITAFGAIADYVQKTGPAIANIILNPMGIAEGAVTQFNKTTKTQIGGANTEFDTLATKVDNASTSITDLASNLSSHESIWAKFGAGWNSFVDQFTQSISLMIKQISSGSLFSGALSTLESQFSTPAGMTSKITQSTTSDSTPVSLITALNNLTTALSSKSPNSPSPTVNLNINGASGITASQIASMLYNQSQGTGGQ